MIVLALRTILTTLRRSISPSVSVVILPPRFKVLVLTVISPNEAVGPTVLPKVVLPFTAVMVRVSAPSVVPLIVPVILTLPVSEDMEVAPAPANTTVLAKLMSPTAFRVAVSSSAGSDTVIEAPMIWASISITVLGEFKVTAPPALILPKTSICPAPALLSKRTKPPAVRVCPATRRILPSMAGSISTSPATDND